MSIVFVREQAGSTQVLACLTGNNKDKFELVCDFHRICGVPRDLDHYLLKVTEVLPSLAEEHELQVVSVKDIDLNDDSLVFVVFDEWRVDVSRYEDDRFATLTIQDPDQRYLHTTAENLRQTLDRYGVAIIPSVIDAQECEAMKAGMWDFLEHATSQLDPPLSRDDEKTWRQFWELYPLHGMLIQHWGIGHAQFLWDLRQNPKIVNIFARLWDVEPEELLVSFDGAAFSPPHEVTNRGYYRNNKWFHFDQRLSDSSLRCVQSWVTAYDVNPGDATLTVLQGSHLLHGAFAERFDQDKNNKDWFKMNEEQIKWLEAQGCEVADITCRAGDMVFWDSRTAHAGKEPLKDRDEPNFRTIGYMCYQPREGIRPHLLKKKVKALQDKRTTSHWPRDVKLFAKTPRTYGKDIPEIPEVVTPKLTKLGKKLAGL